MTKIAIVGATGPTGIHLVAELRKTAAAVRVIARDDDKLVQLFPEAAVEKRSADILDANATPRAIDGCDLVYDCIGLPGDQMHLHPVIARNITRALRQTKARCIQVSSYWAYYPQVPTQMNESHPRRGGAPWVRHRRCRRSHRRFRRALVPPRQRFAERSAGSRDRRASSRKVDQVALSWDDDAANCKPVQ